MKRLWVKNEFPNEGCNFLDLLATVASETLMNDKSLQHIKTRPLSPLSKASTSTQKFTYPQLKKMNSNALLRHFAEPDFNEMKKTYRYRCRLIPTECSTVVKSFGNETKAQNQMKAHLACHVRSLHLDGRIFLPVSSVKTEVVVVVDDPPPPIKEEHGYVVDPLIDHTYAVAFNKKAELISDPPHNDEDGDKEESIDWVRKMLEWNASLEKEEEEEKEKELEENWQRGYVRPIECQDNNDLIPLVGAEVELKNVRIIRGKESGIDKKQKEAAVIAIKRLQAQGSTIPIRDLICSICNPTKRFTAYTTLLNHLKSHIGLKPYECNDCKAVFTRQHSLNYHKLIHENQTRFTCPDCGRKFRHPSHYKEHRRRHNGELPFHCPDCSLRYKTRNTLKRHLKTTHVKVLTSSGAIVRLHDHDDSDPELKELSTKENNKKMPPMTTSASPSASTSSSSMSNGDDDDDDGNNDNPNFDRDDYDASPVEEDPLPESLRVLPISKPNTVKRTLGRIARRNPSPVPNFVSHPPSDVITPKKKKRTTVTISNGVTISKYNDHGWSNNENKKKKESLFRPSPKSAFKTPKRSHSNATLTNVEIRKLVHHQKKDDEVSILDNDRSGKKDRNSAILAEIDGKTVLLIPKNEHPKPKSKLEECLLYGSQRAKTTI